MIQNPRGALIATGIGAFGAVFKLAMNYNVLGFFYQSTNGTNGTDSLNHVVNGSNGTISDSTINTAN